MLYFCHKVIELVFALCIILINFLFAIISYILGLAVKRLIQSFISVLLFLYEFY